MPEAGHARDLKGRIPATLVTGFLGSGKTTLINAALRSPDLSRTIVVVNEFGEVGLDQKLFARSSDSVVILENGCLCCTVRGDLVNTMEKLLRGLDNGRMNFNRVIIETTGLADPAPVLHTIMVHPYMQMRFRLDGVITLVDAVNGNATLDAHVEAVKQVAVADRIVLTKTDLVDAAARARVEARLRALNPAAPILAVAHGALTPDQLLDSGLYDPKTKSAEVARWLKAEAYGAPHEHAHGHDHDHADDHGHDDDHAHGDSGQVASDVNRHDASIRAFCITREAPFTPESLQGWLETLSVYLGPDMLRVKGLLNLEGQPVALHGVQHLFYPLARLPGWPDADRLSKIVFITRDVPRDFVERTLALSTEQAQ